MEFKTTIIDYLGKFEGGIFVKISIGWKGDFYDSLFFYNQDRVILTVDENMISKMGYDIEDHPEYMDLVESIMKMVEPYDKVYEELDNI